MHLTCDDAGGGPYLAVLSVVAQQVLDIQRAIAARVTSFVFEVGGSRASTRPTLSLLHLHLLLCAYV